MLSETLSEFRDKNGLGIDFPIWFDWETGKPKVMVIGRDPQRGHTDNRLFIATPFGLGSEAGRETKANKY